MAEDFAVRAVKKVEIKFKAIFRCR
jgi:hypothetical protein